MNKKPNIVFLLTDDQRYNTINSLGNSEIITPNMNALVDSGTSFTQAHIPSGTSGAVCMPSRAMLNTGRTLFHIEREGQQIPEEHITIGEALKRNGYNTFGIGKWHNGTASYARSFTGGDNIFFGGMWDHWNVPICDYDPSGKYDNQINFTMNFMKDNKPSRIHCDRISAGVHSTELFSQSAINYIENYDSEDPFYMYVAFLAPHDPRTMPKRFLDMYDPDNITLPENFMPEHPFKYGAEEIRDEMLEAYPRTEEFVKKHIAEYYAMITHLDYEIGRIIETLKKTGQLDNTIIVLAGDNGLAVGSHGLMGKQNHYEHSIRVPLIFSGPAVPMGLKVDNYVYLLDVFPTLCDLVNIDIPESVDGKSLVQMMENQSIRLRESLYFAYNDLIRSVKNERFKLIEYRGKVKETQLFDLTVDPYETNNLFGNSEYSAVVEILRIELARYRDEWGEEKHQFGRSFWKKF